MPVLPTPASDAGFRLVHVPTIGSTNAEAFDRAAAGERGPLWIVSDRQTAGRGRRGRTWTSEPGNLFATLLLVDPAPAAHVAELCFVAALAIDDALLGHDPALFERAALKWPNDLLLDGAKAAGILVEASTRGAGTTVAIGIGVNIAHAPDGVPYPVTSLAASGVETTRDRFFARLAGSMVRALSVWRQGEGFDAIRAGWLSRAHGLGGPLALRQNDRTVEGIFVGLDPAGQLILDTPDGRRLFSAGEVILPQGSGVQHT